MTSPSPTCAWCGRPLGENPRQKCCSNVCRALLSRYNKREKLASATSATQAQQVAVAPSEEINALGARLDALTGMVGQVLTMLQSGGGVRGNGNVQASFSGQSSEGMDIELDIRVATNSGENATFNMLLSTLGIGQKIEAMSDDVLEYGLKKNRFGNEADKVRELLRKRGKIVDLPDSQSPVQGKGPKKLAGSDIELPPPDLDDDLLNLLEASGE